MPATQSESKTRSKQPKLSFASSSSATKPRPLSFTPSFSLSRSDTAHKPPGASPALLAPPDSLFTGKGKAKQLEHSDSGDVADVQATDAALWCDKHAPSTTADLAVHKQKVQDVRNWLQDAFSGNPRLAKYRRLLVLTGPAGSGKTATLKALAQSAQLDLELLEWKTQASLESEPHSAGSSMAERFSDFLARAGRYPTLSMSSAGPSPISSASTPKTPASGTQSFSAASQSYASKSSARRKVILIEDLPNIHHLPTKAAFNSALELYLARPLPALGPPGSQQVENCPVVMVISENTPREDDERWAGESSGSGWCDRLGAIMDVRAALEESVRKSPSLSEIRFNPVSPTILIKGLRRIVDLEFPPQQPAKPTRSRSRASVEPPGRPSAQMIQSVADSGTGDIRAAINCLQFLCGNSAPHSGTKHDIDGKSKPASRSAAKAKLAARQLAMISGRESSLSLFHAIGRVLYNKRFGDPGQEQEEQKIRKKAAGAVAPDVSDDSSDEHDLAALRQRLDKAREAIIGAPAKDGELDAIASCELPSHYEALQRRESRVDVQDLWTELPVDATMFQLYLHQNYTAFTSDVDECCEIVSGLSDADWIRCMREEYRHASLLSYYGFLVTVQSTLLHLPSPVPRKNQKLGKAAFWEVRNKTREMDDLIDDAKQWLAEGFGGLDALKGQTGLFGRSAFWPTADELLEANRSDAGLGLESHSSLMRADRRSLATEVIPLLAKMQGGAGSEARSKVPGYFGRIARMRFDWAGVSDMAARKLEEHEIEHRTEVGGGEDELGLTSSQGVAAVSLPADTERRPPTASLSPRPTGAGADADGEQLYLSDDDIDEFS